MTTEILRCASCNGPAVKVQQDGRLSCVRQCHETPGEEISRKMLEGFTADVARLLGGVMPEGVLFTLILSSRKGMAYCSSVQRRATISMLREMADKLEIDGGEAS
jgi:hypothetical protein